MVKFIIFAFLTFSLYFCGLSFAATLSYTYDNLNRLTRVDYGNGTSIDYTYDARGNRLTLSSVSSAAGDLAPPTGSISINGGAALTNSASISLLLGCVDAGVCTQMQFSDNELTWSPWQAYATDGAWTIAPGDGARTVYVRFRDGAGNISTPYSDSIVLDTVPPTLTVSTVSSTVSVDSVTIIGTVEVGAAVTVSTDTAASDGAALVTGSSWSYDITGLAEGMNNVTITAADQAGNITEKSVAIIKSLDETSHSDPLSIYLFYRMLRRR